MKPTAFIAMPFNTKPGADGRPIAFDRIYTELLQPALQDAGCDALRADAEEQAGDIRTDMFQALLVADLVLVDLTIDNPNVWYELGVRHALRARGVVLVYGPRATQPFDTYTDRKRCYGLKDGAPDPATLAADRAAIAEMVRATLDSNRRRIVSPVYRLLPHLQQPQWQQLLLAGDNEFGDAHRQWRSRMDVARQKCRAGDILVLADEAPVRALATEARFHAGRTLLRLQQYAFALEQFDAALATDPDHLGSLQQRVVCLGRLQRVEEAREAAAALTQAHPDDAECWGLVGRVEKDAWTQRFRPANGTPAAPGALQEAAAGEDALLAEAIPAYRRGFVIDARSFYAGINALTLSLLRTHLGGEQDARDTERLLAGLRWAVASGLERGPQDYWARASQAELSLLCGDTDSVRRDWKSALALGVTARDWFALDSSRQTLQLLSEVGFRPEQTALALGLVQTEIARLVPPFTPRQVLLFSGHMVDAPGREKPRFPAGKEPGARAALAKALDALGAGPEDLGLTQGAAGGDLIFTELCLERGVQMQWLQPLPEPDFIVASVEPSAQRAGAVSWRDRYFAAKAKLAQPVRTAPVELGPAPHGVDPWERGNLWLLHTALAQGPDKTRLVCLWDGGGSDGPGGTKHMVEEVKRRTGRVSWVNINDIAEE